MKLIPVWDGAVVRRAHAVGFAPEWAAPESPPLWKEVALLGNSSQGAPRVDSLDRGG